jgi:predicted O-methyltransferase YrrM
MKRIFGSVGYAILMHNHSSCPFISSLQVSSSRALARRSSSSLNGTYRKSNVVTIRASDVAAVLGKNRYKSYDAVFEDMWKRHSPDTFLGQTKEDIAVIAMANCDAVEKLVLTTTAAYEAKDATDAIAKYEEVEKIIQSSITLPQQDKVAVLEQLKSNIFTGEHAHFMYY